jgi:hypothetical protein
MIAQVSEDFHLRVLLTRRAQLQRRVAQLHIIKDVNLCISICI